SAFIRNPMIKAEDLDGARAEPDLPVYIDVGQPPSQDRSLADVWSALGGELKPSLDLIVTAPFVVEVAQPAGPPVLEEPRLAIVTPLGNEEAGGSRRPDRVAAGRLPPSPDETRKAGAENQPGRIVRVHGIGR
ncbi:MAG: Pvc16 family protein, partial [Candidatus Limnocylindrales bacterium]